MAAITVESIRQHMIRNAKTYSEMVETARRVTNNGAGGPSGKRYNGYFFHQIVRMFVGQVENTYAPDDAPIFQFVIRALSAPSIKAV